MQHSILKNLLSSSFYNDHKDKLKHNLFADEAKDLFDIITAAHQKYGNDLSTKEVMALFDIHFPIATKAEKGAMQDLIEAVDKATPLSNEVAADVLQDLYRKEWGRQIAHYGISITEGEYSAIDRIKSMLASVGENFVTDDLPEPCKLTLDELIEDQSNDNRWAFNISTLRRHVYGIGAGEFMTVFALSNTGKSAFGISLSCAPGGYCDQGAKVLYIGNEESVKRMRLRAMIAWAGISAREIANEADKRSEARRKWQEIEDRIDFIDAQDLDLNTVEACIARSNCDVCVIDMADKVNISGNYNAGHERLRELYRRLREAAKTYECALIGISQASADAEGRTRLSFTMMEGSKIGKASESDLIIGIGKHSGDASDDEPDNTRFLTVSKNKISGWHGTEAVTLLTELNRYVE